MGGSMDDRREKRNPESLQILLSSGSQPVVAEDASTENISACGARVQTERPWRPDTPVFVKSQRGEFWARAPHTATPGWIRSGDLVRRDAEDYIYVAGRMSDVINRGGEKIDPAEVEAVLWAHEDVTDVAVAGFPDADLGENVGAVIVARRPVDPKELRDWARARLASHKVPARIVFVDELPLTELGKVSRRDLGALITQG